jgi:hypothetical protein
LYWDGTTIHKISNISNAAWPSLYKGTIAWMQYIDGDYEIYYWDGTTTHIITDTTVREYYPSLYNGTIAWYSDVYGDFEIYYWDGGDFHNIHPVVYAGANQAVFDSVTLDGGASYDPDGSVVSYDWLLKYRSDSSVITISGVNPTISDLYSGLYDVTLTVTDDEGATGTDTSLVAAAGPCVCTASTMHIESITAGTVRGSKGNSKGEVTVTVSDDYGKPVAAAIVTGTFYTPFDEEGRGVTDSNGVAVIRTTEEFKKPLYDFCVDDVVKGLLTYYDVDICVHN